MLALHRAEPLGADSRVGAVIFGDGQPLVHPLLQAGIGRRDEIRLLFEGEGVVGEQPLVAPSGTYEYHSFCALKSPRGWMEGHYHFARPDGSAFDALIPRFVLDADADVSRE